MKIFGITILYLVFSQSVYSAVPNPLGGQPLELDSQQGFLIMSTAAAASVFLAEFVSKDNKLNFYDVHTEFYTGERSAKVISQGVGIERAMANWFSLAAEFAVQHNFGPSDSATGASINAKYRWYVIGKYGISPYFGYSAGAFYTPDTFPTGGSNFTFRLLYLVGFEFKLSQNERIRVDIGHIHHSNNNLFPTNPGYDGNGISVAYAWLMGR